MKKNLVWIVPMALLLTTIAYGEVVANPPLPDSSFLGAVWDYIRQINGVKAAVVGLVALGTTFFNTTLGQKLAGGYTLAVLYALSAVGFLIEGLFSGTAVMAIVTNAVFTAAALNSFNEILKHIFEKKPLDVVHPVGH